MEDGREVFDDDLGDDCGAQAKSGERGSKKRDAFKGAPGRKNNIKNMLIGMPSKNKEVGLYPVMETSFVCSSNYSFFFAFLERC